MTSSDLTRQLQRRYAVLVAVVRKIAAEVNVDNFTRARKRLAERLLDRAIHEANIQVSAFAETIVKKAYNEQKKKMQAVLKRKKYSKVKDEGGHNKKVVSLMDGFKKQLITINLNLKKTAIAYIDLVEKAAAKLVKVQEFQQTKFVEGIKDIVARMAETSLGKIKKELNDYFHDSFGDFDVIIIGDRMYQLSKYLEMVSRTELMDFLTQATIETCKQYGDDLVQFSHHDSPCEICAPLEGEIFSISGESTKYPKLTSDATTPVHPRCEHGLNPVSLSEARA